MNNLFLAQVLLVVILTLGSCQTKEEKAAKLIRDDLYKYLNDFSSYEPIETKIDSAFTSIYRDSLILEYASLCDEYLDTAIQYINKLKEIRSEVELWSDSYSSYGTKRYQEAIDEYKMDADKLQEYKFKIDELQKLINEKILIFKVQFCGWEAKHKFRCKTKGGVFDLPTFVFVFDPKIRKIIYRENLNDENLIKLIGIIDAINKPNSE